MGHKLQFFIVLHKIQKVDASSRPAHQRDAALYLVASVYALLGVFGEVVASKLGAKLGNSKCHWFLVDVLLAHVRYGRVVLGGIFGDELFPGQIGV